MATSGQATYISLVDSIEYGAEWLKLPFDAMREIGPATQTLGGILRLTFKEMYVPVDDIAHAARLRKRTAFRHLDTLHEHGWIKRKGRQKTRSGWLRRTATIVVTGKARAASKTTYGVLPWWACCSTKRHGRFTWGSKAVLSIILGRMMSLKAGIEQQDGHGLDEDDFWGSLENMDGQDRFLFSLDQLQRQTGLSRPSIVDAKRQLAKRKVICWEDSTGEHGESLRDLLYPKASFRAVCEPCGNGRCYLSFSDAFEENERG